jgi:FkbM family methyltransferase
MNQHWLMSVRPAFVASALKKVLGITRRPMQTPHGVFFADPVSNFGSALQRPEGYEPDLTAAMLQILKPGGVFLDVGANEGYFSVLAAKAVGAGGRVIALEPQSRLQAVIQTNAQNNGHPNIELMQVAIADSVGSAEIFLSPDINTGSSGLFRSARYAVPTERIEQLTFSALFERLNLPHVDLMKMDIEGFEFEAILGSPEIFKAGRIGKMALELHPTILARRGKDIGELNRFLDQCGYRASTGFQSHILVFEKPATAA